MLVAQDRTNVQIPNRRIDCTINGNQGFTSYKNKKVKKIYNTSILSRTSRRYDETD